MKAKLRIAFFTCDWNFELVETTLHGAARFAQDHQEVQICVFDCFGKEVANPRSMMEYGIYTLPDLEAFDGLLIQSNQIVLGEIRTRLEKRIDRVGIPAMAIDCPMKSCTLVGVDNYQSQKDIALHVIRQHGAKNLVYLTGLESNDSPEGVQRREGFLDACAECGIPEENIRIYHGNWLIAFGEKTAKDLLAVDGKMPDAIICANDEMAQGVIDILQENGLDVPDDVIVTGYDCLSSGQLSRPRLTTVSRDYESLTYKSLEQLVAQIGGEPVKDKVSMDYDLIFAESCGCHSEMDRDTLRRQFFRQTRFLKRFYMIQDAMAEELFNANDLPELMDTIEKYHFVLGVEDLYLCMNDFYFESYDKKKWRTNTGAFSDRMYLVAQANREKEPDERHIYDTFGRKELISDEILERERFLMFYPLHYNTDSIGYIVLTGISEAAKMNLHESIFSFIEIAIENVRKKGQLQQLNAVLGDLYVHDALTGLYNRFGYHRYAEDIYRQILARGEDAQILFVDMDDMKKINDVHGHEAGDLAITETARILKEASGGGDFLMRYGGDEFLLIASGATGSLQERIHEKIRCFNESGAAPFRLSLSIGTYLVKNRESKSLDECVHEADTRMYQYKDIKKRAGRV